MTVTNVSLNASPVSPEVETEAVWAPELAELVALPVAVASPELPDVPLLPEVEGDGEPAPLIGMKIVEPPTGMEIPPEPALPPNTLAMPRMPVFRANGLLVAEPVLPGVPEVPEVARGLETAVEVAAPVSPELVALDWARDAPLSPVMALGLAVTSAEPPAPPPELLVETTLPAPTTAPGAQPSSAAAFASDGQDVGEVGGVAGLARLRRRGGDGARVGVAVGTTGGGGRPAVARGRERGGGLFPPDRGGGGLRSGGRGTAVHLPHRGTCTDEDQDSRDAGADEGARRRDSCRTSVTDSHAHPFLMLALDGQVRLTH